VAATAPPAGLPLLPDERAELSGWPRVPLAEGIKRAVAWSTEWGQQHQHKGVIGEDKGSSSR